VIRPSRKVVDAAALYGSQFCNLAIGVILTPIAARALENPKEELGVWALLLLVSGFASIFARGSLGSFTIRHASMTIDEKSSLYWMSLALGAATCSVVFLLSSSICAFLRIPEWTTGLMVLSCSFVPQAWQGVAGALLRREKRFGSMLIIDLLRSVIQIILTTILLTQGFGLWSYISVSLGANIAIAIVATLLTGWPKLVFKRSLCKEAWRYSSGLLGFNAINFWGRNLDNALIGRVLGSAALGIYSNAYRLMMLPVTTINQVLQSLLLPYLAPYQAEPDLVRQKLMLSIRTLGLIVVPLMTVLWLECRTVARWYFGPGWDDVGELLVILVPVGISQSLISPLGVCYQVSGKTGVLFRLGLVNTLVLACGFLLGVQYDLMTFVWIYAGANALLLYPTVRIGMGTVDGTFADWLVGTWPLFAIPLASIMVQKLLIPEMPQDEILHIGLTVAVIVFVSAMTMFLFLRDAIGFVVEQLGVWRSPRGGSAQLHL
tara:strand:- start:260640 stop:262109 length:1470 start_codon:yes stop_codon:yes gene_type:complete